MRRHWLHSLLLLGIVAFALPCPSASADTKRGMAGIRPLRENAMNTRWVYNWGNLPPDDIEPFHGEFVPMIWSGNPTGVTSQINTILDYKEDYNVDYVLGFNEPELPDQANMTVQQALDTWDVMTDGFAGSGIKLVSPAVEGKSLRALENWIYPFMDEVNVRNSDTDPENDLQVDAIGYHFYTVGTNPALEAQKILDAVDDLHNRYGLPIWLTEFAGVNFLGTADVDVKRQFNEDLLEILIPAFESRDHVERYAWWQFGRAGKAYSQLSTVQNGVYTPTIIGDVYAGTLRSGDSYDFTEGSRQPTDVQYLRGGTLTNTGPGLPTALRALDAIEDVSVISGTAGADWNLTGGDDTFVRVRTGATLEKRGANTIRFQTAPVTVDGTLRVEQGVLSLEAGTEVLGTGVVELGAGGTVSFGAASDTSGSSIRQALTLYGGSLVSNPVAEGQHAITGTTSVEATTTFDGAGDLTVRGNLITRRGSVGGGLTKLGTGTLYLTGSNNYAGPTSIQNGELVAASRVGTATGGGPVQVASSGTLAGRGQVLGAVTVEAGGRLAPGVAKSNLGLTSSVSIDPGVVVDAVDFDFTGVQDDAPLVATSTLNPALELVSGFNFGPGTSARNAANEGDEFNVMGFTNGATFADASNAGDYLTFTVAPVKGLAMTLEDVTYELRRNGGGAATGYAVATSIDGFTAADRLQSDLVLPTSDTARKTYTATYAGSESTADPVEVRLYGWGASSGFGNTHLYNVSLDASFLSDPDHVEFDPTGVLELGGDYTQLDFGVMAIDLGGTANPDPESAEFDQLLIAGAAQLDGTLDLKLLDGYTPTPGDTFSILTAGSVAGEFDTVLGPAGYNVGVEYSGSTVSVEILALTLEGDFNGDGVVDAIDYAVWRDNLGAAEGTLLAGNGDGSGIIDLGDHALWAANYGTTATAPANAGAVPEPASLVALLVTLGAALHQRRN